MVFTDRVATWGRRPRALGVDLIYIRVRIGDNPLSTVPRTVSELRMLAKVGGGSRGGENACLSGGGEEASLGGERGEGDRRSGGGGPISSKRRGGMIGKGEVSGGGRQGRTRLCGRRGRARDLERGFRSHRARGVLDFGPEGGDGFFGGLATPLVV